jgi:hypothetical protein
MDGTTERMRGHARPARECVNEGALVDYLFTADAGCLLLAASRQATLSSTQGDDEFETA